jgi:hypothetical protein
MPTAKVPLPTPVNIVTGSKVDQVNPNKSYEWPNITVSAAKILKKSKLF